MSTPAETMLCEYRYDALDSLSSQNFPNDPVRQRFYCKSRLATEIQAGIGRSIVQHENLLLAEQQHENSAIATRLLATDLQRSVLHTLAGIHRHAIAYSPYGHRRAESGLSSLLGFNGERPDPVTGHYLLGNGYRAFNPVLMRFNGPDSLSPFGKGGLNAYGYCKGDPINFVDPTGHVSRALKAMLNPSSIAAARKSAIRSSAAAARKRAIGQRLSRIYSKLKADADKATKIAATMTKRFEELALEGFVDAGRAPLPDLNLQQISAFKLPRNTPSTEIPSGLDLRTLQTNTDVYRHRRMLPLYEETKVRGQYSATILYSMGVGEKPSPVGFTASAAMDSYNEIRSFIKPQIDSLNQIYAPYHDALRNFKAAQNIRRH